ncbi:hypothetical protein Ac2012v2_002592 [Leucoagaricus gongylophorus]
MDVFYLLFCLSLVLFSTAQTLTTTDVAGVSVVVVVSTDPAGINPPVFQTIQTLVPGVAGDVLTTTSASTSTSTSPTSTLTTSTTTPPVAAAPIAQGPVAQPAPTPQGAGGVTPYTYTTVINGVTTAVADNFTPTNPATTPYTPTRTGTIWNYSQYMSIFGPPSQTTSGTTASFRNRSFGSFTMLACLVMILIF